MSDIVKTICELSNGEYWSNTQSFKEEFISRFYNGSDIFNKLDLNECTQFYDRGSNAELLIYNGRQCVYSCCYTGYYNQKIITCIYEKNGLVYNYNIDYDKLEKEFSKKKI
ncbi:hypothetical protein [Lacrimispora sp.]|uniref:hypothetical protein n=1 Tax=Lacrimispora sp. TaxID=2719234 RepID=UPI0028AAC3DF|nr:hypothetical protein [Lacrimispora sp.]